MTRVTLLALIFTVFLLLADGMETGSPAQEVQMAETSMAVNLGRSASIGGSATGFRSASSVRELESGAITGRVVLQARAGSGQGRFAGRYARRAAPQQADTGQSILIWIEGDGSVEASRDEPVVLDQVDQAFHPDLLAVRVNESVRILNSDPVYHNVFSYSSVKRFDVGRRPQGDYYDVQFDRQGVVDVFCDIHSNMHAVIYVVGPDTIEWKRISEEEEFQIDQLRQGSYTLNVFSPGYELYNRRIEVNGETVQVGTIRLSP